MNHVALMETFGHLKVQDFAIPFPPKIMEWLVKDRDHGNAKKIVTTKVEKPNRIVESNGRLSTFLCHRRQQSEKQGNPKRDALGLKNPDLEQTANGKTDSISADFSSFILSRP